MKRKRTNSNVSAKSLEWKPPSETDKAEVVQEPHRAFSRINMTKFAQQEGHNADYSYEAKATFGTTGDTYGDWSNMKLKDKVGKGFTKEKNKMKNKNFHSSGGRFNMGSVNSVSML